MSSTEDGVFIESAKRSQRNNAIAAGAFVVVCAVVGVVLKWDAIAAFFSHHLG